MKVSAGPLSLRITCFPWQRTLMLFAVVTGIAAFYMTLHRNEGYDVRCSRGADLYQLSEMPRIDSFAFDPTGLLTADLVHLEESRWRRAGREGAAAVIEGEDPVIALEPGITETVLRGETSGRTLTFRTQWGGPGQADPLVSHASLRVGPASPYSIDDFVISPTQQPPGDVAGAHALLAPLDLNPEAPSLDRIAAIAAFLHGRLYPHRGAPAPAMARLNGFQQYKEALAGRTGVYCANHAEIYAFMANAVGLKTRVVDVAGQVGDVSVGAHSFAETYLEEEGRWIYVDLQLGLAGVRTREGVYLGAAPLLARIRNGTTAGLVAQTIREGALVAKDWSERAKIYETFLTPTASLVFLSSTRDRYAPMARLQRLLVSPRPALCEGGLPDLVNHRLAATWAFVAVAGVWLAIRLRHMSGRCGCIDGD